MKGIAGAVPLFICHGSQGSGDLPQFSHSWPRCGPGTFNRSGAILPSVTSIAARCGRYRQCPRLTTLKNERWCVGAAGPCLGYPRRARPWDSFTTSRCTIS
jgi:hypothetical protein